jgi:hypothetical protein
MGKVTIKEAADRLGVVEATVRRRIHRGELQAVQESTPQGFVWMVDVPDCVDKVQEGSAGEVEALHEFVEVLRDELEGKDRELAARDHQLEVKDRQLEERAREVQELHVLLQRAQAALPASRQDRLSWWRRILHLSSV